MFRGKKVELKVMDMKYLDTLMKVWNNPELKQYLMGAIPHSRLQEEEWIKRTQRLMGSGQEYVFAIERLDTHKFIGTVGIHDILWVAKTATVGIAIYRQEDREQGFGTEALQLAIEFAWKDLNLRRLELSVHSFNKRAIKTYEKLGFKQWGIAHQKMFIRGKYVDTHYMELFRYQSQSASD
ncbi:MAG: GNAT family N-acetyltransferase [Candidatus Thorarchaeota archaeon]